MMDRFDTWDGVLLVVAAYVAINSLVRMMANHRQRVSAELLQQIHAEQHRKKLADNKKKQQEKKGRAA